MYRITHKRLSDIAEKVIVVTEDFDVPSAETGVSGVLILWNAAGDLVKAIPPGFWFECDRVEDKSLVS
jgi:hypothetical protein